MSKPLPPFGKQFYPVPSSGVRVAIGPGAWSRQQTHSHPIMVLPVGFQPGDFRWPSDDRPALIFECGAPHDHLLREMAERLLLAGASSVVAVRESLLRQGDPRLFFDPVVQHVVA